MSNYFRLNSSITAGDTIVIHQFKAPDRKVQVYDRARAHDYEVIERDGEIGIMWPDENNTETFKTLDSFDPQLTRFIRTNEFPVEITPEEFARLFAEPLDQVSDVSERLRRALLRAGLCADAAMLQDDDDSGTCNMDSPAFDFSAAGIKRAMAEKVIRAVNLDCYDWTPFCGGRKSGRRADATTYLVITGCTHGQGNLRTRMAQAFCDSLNRDGFQAGMYWQMD